MIDKLEKIFNIETFAVGGVISSLISFLGGRDDLLEFLILAMAIDYATGIVKSIIQKNLSSRVGFNGILRKAIMLLVIGFGVGLDNILQLQGDTLNIRNLLLMFYIGSEGISLLENVEAIGVPIPTKLREILIQCRDKGEK